MHLNLLTHSAGVQAAEDCSFLLAFLGVLHVSISVKNALWSHPCLSVSLTFFSMEVGNLHDQGQLSHSSGTGGLIDLTYCAKVGRQVVGTLLCDSDIGYNWYRNDLRSNSGLGSH